jgi:phosphate starvation-inducible PhoH-like protein
MTERARLKSLFNERIQTSNRKPPIHPKTAGQKKYIEAMRKHDVTFGLGPAGTGKTYLAMAMAVTALKAGTVSRIILTRPAVEAGEALGFLPGDLYEKLDPYLRPCKTLCTTCCQLKKLKNTGSEEPLKLPHWHTCEAAL